MYPTGRIQRCRPTPRRWASVVALLLILVSVVVGLHWLLSTPWHDTVDLYDAVDVRQFDNVTGADRFIVPNIVHFIRFNSTSLSFVDYVCLKAVMRNHRPDRIFIHSDTARMDGRYWHLIRDGDRELWSRLAVLPLQVPDEVFGQKLDDDFRLHHGSDIARLRLLMQYGGIYLDNDAYVVANLDKYRRFEMVVDWADDKIVGNQVLIANKNARMLPLWLATYDVYRPDRWYYNGGLRPTVEALAKRPEWLHRVKGRFGVDFAVSMSLYLDEHFDGWRRLDVIHLAVNHRDYLDPLYGRLAVFDEDNIADYPFPFGEMARDVIDDSPGLRPVALAIKSAPFFSATGNDSTAKRPN